MPLDTLVVFYHPAKPGFYKRLRAEYRLPPAYVEACHPAAALLDGDQHGWEVAGLAIAPITETVYYWTETLKEASDAKTLYTLTAGAYAKRLDTYVTPRLAKFVEVAVVPMPGELGGWRFQAQYSHTLLHTIYHVLEWGLNLDVRRHGVVRVYVDVSLAPHQAAEALVEASFILAALLAAKLGTRIEYSVYTAPMPPTQARKTPLVDLQQVESMMLEPQKTHHLVAAKLHTCTPRGPALTSLTPKARVPRELSRRLQRLAEKGVLAAKALLTGLSLGYLALVCTERNPIQTLLKILSELLEVDLSNTVIQKYVEGGVVAHHSATNPSHLKAVAYTLALSALTANKCSILDELDPEKLQEIYRSAPPHIAAFAKKLIETKAWKAKDIKEAVCNPDNALKALQNLLIHPATLHEHNGKLLVDTDCVREALKKLHVA